MQQHSYREYFEIAAVVRRHSPEQFKMGVERAAALAAVNAGFHPLLIEDAMLEVFTAYRSNNNRGWDGSIG